MAIRIEVVQERDERWVAELMNYPSILLYGPTRELAIAKAQSLFLRELADRISPWNLGESELFFCCNLAAKANFLENVPDRREMIRALKSVAAKLEKNDVFALSGRIRDELDEYFPVHESAANVNTWQATETRVVLEVLARNGWRVQERAKRWAMLHKIEHGAIGKSMRFCLFDTETLGPEMLARFARQSGVTPDDFKAIA